jgi:KDO2-lipid IV(A) lauroyltransferase
MIDEKKLFACMLLSDQSPSNYRQSYWMKFLNQDTPVLYGPEYFAKKYDLPIFYYEVAKRKPGYYEVTLIPVSVDSKNTAYGEITYKHNKLLEETIIKNPSQWLWSHKRWKHSLNASEFEVHQ